MANLLRGYVGSMSERTGDDIWGERTPYSPGETWPVRVDLRLVGGLGLDEVDSLDLERRSVIWHLLPARPRVPIGARGRRT